MGCIDDSRFLLQIADRQGSPVYNLCTELLLQKRLPRNSDVKFIGSFRPVLRIAFKG